MVDLFRERKWDLIKHRNIWFALSLLVILPGVAALFTRGLNYGIDFTGGGLLSYQLVKPIGIGQQTQAIHDVRAIVNGLGIANQVNLAGSGSNPTVRDQIIIRTQIKQSRREASQQVDEQDRSIFAALHARPEFAGLKTVERRTVSGVVSGSGQTATLIQGPPADEPPRLHAVPVELIRSPEDVRRRAVDDAQS